MLTDLSVARHLDGLHAALVAFVRYAGPLGWLLDGSLSRPRLRCEEEAVLVVAPDDAPDWRAVELGPRPAVTTRRTGPRGDGDRVRGGAAVDLDLSLWNRTGRPALAGTWRGLAAVTWT